MRRIALQEDREAPITPVYMDRQTLSIMKACEVVGVSRRTIYNWIASGKVEYVRTAGGSIRLFEDSLWREPGAQGRQVDRKRVARELTADDYGQPVQAAAVSGRPA